MDHSNQLTLDIECYRNYLLVMFKKITSGEVLYFEKFNDSELNTTNILHILNKYTLVTFNGNKYDKVILEVALAGINNAGIHKASGMLIDDRMQAWQVRKQFGIASVWFDHIDLIEVAPLKASLKIYAGRMHSKKMQDLPIEPSATILPSDLKGMRSYCEDDNDDTIDLLKTLDSAIDLRVTMGKDYNVDLRSKSDAQIAEVVIKHEMDKKYGVDPKRPKIEIGTQYKFDAPDSLVFKTKLMQDIFSEFKKSTFVVGKSGHMDFLITDFKRTEDGKFKRNRKGDKIPYHPIKGKKFEIGNTTYKIGIGGLHSCEKAAGHKSGEYLLKEYDVATYYPRVILINKLAPKHLGEAFLTIFKIIVNRRLEAKKEKGNKNISLSKREVFDIINESLKITINGTFGKLGSKWSFLYAPDLMMQVTLTGQLSLLMLIERLELAGISVVSGNTDGIVTKMLPEQEQLVRDIVSDWEFDTDYEMEETKYLGLYSRSVNDYIAIAENYVKSKGAFADPRVIPNILKVNPANEISTDAVKLFLSKGIPLEETIKSCTDVTKFVTIRTVNGGALYEGKLVGKAIRWYYGKHEMDCMRYKTSGNKVPRSDGAVPLMELPNSIPDDMDFDWYINESNAILKNVGYKENM